MEEATVMNLAVSHSWDLQASEARDLQARLAEKVITETTFDAASVRTVAGIDVSIRSDRAQAAVVVLALPELGPVDCALAEAPVPFPYVPGLLAFREGPSVLAALERLRVRPDLLIFDAQGVAHHRRLGLAAHMGVILDWPSIGCAKSRLVGSHEEPGGKVGDWTLLYDGSETIGAVVRSRAGVKPLYVSIGHRVDLPTAVDCVLRCTRGFRLPETTRLAHKAAGGANIKVPHAGYSRPEVGRHE
jgi:deoxyribonuclease V